MALQETDSLRKAARDNERYVSNLRMRDSSVLPETVKLYHSDVTLGLQELQESAAESEQEMVRVSFSHMHSAQAAEHFNGQNAGSSITVMNFANGHRAGGGYLGGARAQEEALCRQFPLYHPSMFQKQTTL